MARKIRGSTQIMDDSVPPGKISDQGHGGGLDADTLDGKHASELLAGPLEQTWKVWATLVFPVPGTLEVKADASLSLPAPSDLDLHRVHIYVKTPPTGQPVIVDVKLDGASIFAGNPGNRPTIQPGQNWGISGAPDFESVSANQVFTTDTVQVGSGEPGADLTTQVRCQQEVF